MNFSRGRGGLQGGGLQRERTHAGARELGERVAGSLGSQWRLKVNLSWGRGGLQGGGLQSRSKGVAGQYRCFFGRIYVSFNMSEL